MVSEWPYSEHIAHANLVLNPLLLEGVVVVVGLAIVAGVAGVGLGGIKFRNSGRDG